MRMPEVAANATAAVLAEWLVAENAEFAAADAIATVETEKAVVDVEAEDAGVVLKTLVAPGSQVEVGAPIAVLGAPGEAVDDLDRLLVELGVVVDTAPVVPERRDVGRDVRLGPARIHPELAGVDEPRAVERRDHRHRLADGEQLGCHHLRSVTGAACLLLIIRFLPAVAHTNEYAADSLLPPLSRRASRPARARAAGR